jgi:hypothetical protein
VAHDRCFPVNTTLERESNLYQLNYLSLMIHTSAKAAQVGGLVDLDGYNFINDSTFTLKLIKIPPLEDSVISINIVILLKIN